MCYNIFNGLIIIESEDVLVDIVSDLYIDVCIILLVKCTLLYKCSAEADYIRSVKNKIKML